MYYVGMKSVTYWESNDPHLVWCFNLLEWTAFNLSCPALDREECSSESVFGMRSYMNPNDTRQYLYKLTPTAPAFKNTKVCMILCF